MDGFQVAEAETAQPAIAIEELKPRVKNFIPKDCTMCLELRRKAGRSGQSFSVVYGKSGNLRYCRCKFCHHTWKELGNQ